MSLPADCWNKCLFEVEKGRAAARTVGIEARGLFKCLANVVILAI